MLFTRSRHGATEAAYTAKARKRLTEWVMPTYEDVVDVIGEVRMANVGPGTFSLHLDDAETLVTGRSNRMGARCRWSPRRVATKTKMFGAIKVSGPDCFLDRNG